jgi:hypothetical protein
MPVTQVGAIYATGSLLLQRIYIPDSNDSEIDQQHVGVGETLVKVPIATLHSGGHPAVQSAIGTPTFSGRCAVVDQNSNLVVDLIIADPVLYSDPRGPVIAHDHVAHGDLWTGVGANFTRRYVEINPNAAIALAAIVAVSVQNIDTAAPTTAGNVLMNSPTLNVGSLLPAQLFAKLKANAIVV